MPSPLNILVAYPYLKQDSINYLKEFNSKYPNTLCFFLDSGAFTAFNSGKSITLDDYCSFIKSLPFEPWRYILLDVIGNEEKTKENYNEMLVRGFNPVPVFTHGSNWADVDYYYDKSDFICYGGLVGKKGSSEVINDIDKFMKSTKGRKAHLLGYTSLRYLKKFKPYSCDSSSWLAGRRYGQMMIYMGNGKTKAIGKKDIISNPDAKVKDRLKLMGFDLKKIKQNSGWKGGASELSRVSTASWISLSLDMEKNIGTKLFLACASSFDLKMVCDAYLQITGLRK